MRVERVTLLAAAMVVCACAHRPVSMGMSLDCTIESIALSTPHNLSLAFPGRHRLSGVAHVRCRSAAGASTVIELGLVDSASEPVHVLQGKNRPTLEQASLRLFADSACAVPMPYGHSVSPVVRQRVMLSPQENNVTVGLPFCAELTATQVLLAGALSTPSTLRLWRSDLGSGASDRSAVLD